MYVRHYLEFHTSNDYRNSSQICKTLTNFHDFNFTHMYIMKDLSFGGARGVLVIVIGIEHGDTSSNPRRD